MDKGPICVKRTKIGAIPMNTELIINKRNNQEWVRDGEMLMEFAELFINFGKTFYKTIPY